MKRHVYSNGLTLHEAQNGSIHFAFTERTGGVSSAPYASLNLGSHVGDKLSDVEENRIRVLDALTCKDRIDNLLIPNQVHGDNVACVRQSTSKHISHVKETIAEGADAIVCTAPNVPVMLCFADCVPVILTCTTGFAVIHSGWKGTIARISAKAARVLMEEAHCSAQDIRAYIGPHIQGDEYEVSSELMSRFAQEFNWEEDRNSSCLLNLAKAITESLVDAGIPLNNIEDTQLSTVSQNNQFFSYRAEHGTCGRHAAIAVMR